MGDVILFKEDVDQLNSLLKNLVSDAKILSALLITKDTRVLACQGPVCSTDTSALAALLVGSYASTQAIAGLIGETAFDTLSHCGRTRNVLICLIDDETILATIFDKSSTSDRINVCVQKHLEVLKKALRSIGNNTTHDLFDLGASAAGGADIGDEFEARADALSKGAHPEEREAPAAGPGRAERGQKPQPAQAPAAHGEIKRPPDTETIIIEQARGPEETVAKSHEAPAAQAKAADEEAPMPPRKAEKRPPRDHREPPAESEPDPAVPNPDAKAPGSPEAFHMSMNYLKNKTREGALYYHYDKTFFKKFFKSSHKKKP
jgi:hypothetical protein